MPSLLRILSPVFLLATAQYATAANLSFAGTFSNDTDVQIFTFDVLNPTAGVALRTWSYAGGTNAAGQIIPVVASLRS